MEVTVIGRSWMERESTRIAMLEVETKMRPFGGPELREFWGSACEACGAVRPEGSSWGVFACDCERQRASVIRQEFFDEHRERVAAAILERANVPPRFRTASIDNFERSPGSQGAGDGVERWLGGFDPQTRTGVLLAGPFGVGKTHLAVGAMKAVISTSFVEARFASAGVLVDQVRSAASGSLDWDPIKAARKAELLILDDLGRETGSDFTNDLIAGVISHRYDNALPTILTSNLGPDAVAGLFGGGIASRLREMVHPYLMSGTDYRGRKEWGG